jgi:hypothetical protein
MTKSIEKEIFFSVLNNPGDTFYENVLSDFLDEQGVEHDFRKPLHNKKVVKLKPYQEKCLDIWAKHWISIGLCTKPTDEIKAEKYFYHLYKELDLKKPKSIIWFDNPIEMCDQASCQTSDQLWNQLQNKISNKVNDQINTQIYNQLWRKMNSQVWQVWSWLLTLVRNRVWNQV